MMVWSLPFDDVDLEFGDGYGAGGFAGEFEFDADAEVIAVTLRTSRLEGRPGAQTISHVMRPLARGSWLECRLAETIQRDYRDAMLDVIADEMGSRRPAFLGLSYANSAGRRL